MYVYVCIYMLDMTVSMIEVHVCMYVCMHVCMYVCMYVCMCMRMYVYARVRMYVCACMYMYVCICMYMYSCMLDITILSLYICMYTYITNGATSQQFHRRAYNPTQKCVPKITRSPSMTSWLRTSLTPSLIVDGSWYLSVLGIGSHPRRAQLRQIGRVARLLESGGRLL